MCFAVSPRPLTSPPPLPHNRQVLKEMGYAFVVIKPGIDEKAVRHSDPYKVPLVVARAKAKVRLPTVVLRTKLLTLVCQALESKLPASCRLLLTADQVVMIGGKLCEKPSSIDEVQRRCPCARPASCALLHRVCSLSGEEDDEAACKQQCGDSVCGGCLQSKDGRQRSRRGRGYSHLWRHA